MIEQTILTNLIKNEDYVRKVLPYVKPEYFTDLIERTIFKNVLEYFEKYNQPPPVEAISLSFDDSSDFTEDQYAEAKTALSTIDSGNDLPNMEWLLDETEKWCSDRAIYNAIMESIKVIDGKSDKSRGALPGILSDALSVSFDPHIGHDFIDDAEDRWKYYNQKEIKLPFDLETFNAITKGGLSKKTLNIALAGTGVGKSMFMCHCAAANLRDNKNVLYITLEMAEEKIAERIDANLMGLTIDDVHLLPEDVYEKKINRIKENHKGKIVIKEYPTTGASTNHFRYLLNELKIKKNLSLIHI